MTSEATAIEPVIIDAKAVPARSMAPVKRWLTSLTLLVWIMVLVGGITRLTDSGLSITEWAPIMGAIPPLNAAEWQIAFDKYKLLPEYQIQNQGMSLFDFQFIYWWEWGHRLLGRVIGVVFLLPFLYFAATRRLSWGLASKLLVVGLLGALQGALGWYMVQSGLQDRVDVSQYRLAAHFGLAALLFAALLWINLGIGRVRAGGFQLQSFVAGLILALVFLQLISGAFVAGLDAGHASYTWPKMNGAWIPEGMLTLTPVWLNAVENALAAQFNHRNLAYVVLVLCILHAWWSFRFSSIVLAYIACTQVGIGVLTIIFKLPLGLALTHQTAAMLVLAAAVWNLRMQTLRKVPVPDLK